MTDLPDRQLAEAPRAAELLSELARLEQENALLRRALSERSLAPRARRIVGSIAALLVLVLGGAVVALIIERDSSLRSARQGIEEGWAAGGASRNQPPTQAAPRAPAPGAVPAPH